MVDLDSNPTKLIEIVEVGKQLLITRGALTTFSIANDIAKYFAILPAIFVATYAAAGESEGPLAKLNVMDLGHAAVGDHLRDRLQRDRDPDAGPDRAARRQVPGRRRDRAAAPQPADLRRRRPDRPVRRHQAHRPRSSTTCWGRDDGRVRLAHEHGPRLGLRLRVAVTKWRLDRELAAGASPPRDDEHALRAAQLVERRRRERLARGLRRAIASGSKRRGAGVPVCRAAVLEAQPALLALVDDLARDPRPRAARGRARARDCSPTAAARCTGPGRPAS